MAKFAICLHDIPLTKLRERVDARALREESILGLMESIREVGVISPLRVRFKAVGESDVYEITAGRHRHEAARRLGLATVPCIIEADDDLHAELAMIDENLMRAELSPADRAKQTARRKEIYEELHPEARHGGDRKSSGQLGHLISDRFSKEAAAATGKSGRVFDRLTRAEWINPYHRKDDAR